MDNQNLAISVRDAGPGVRVLDVVGEITGFSEETIGNAHEKATADNPKAVVLNFEGLEYMNSGGIGLLVTTLIRAQRSGHQLLAYGLTDHYREIFSLTRLDEAIGLFADEASAVSSVS